MRRSDLDELGSIPDATEFRAKGRKKAKRQKKEKERRKESKKEGKKVRKEVRMNKIFRERNKTEINEKEREENIKHQYNSKEKINYNVQESLY